MRIRTFINGALWVVVCCLLGFAAMYVLRFLLFDQRLIAAKPPRQTWLLLGIVAPPIFGAAMAIRDMETILGAAGGVTVTWKEKEYWRKLSYAQVFSLLGFVFAYGLFETFD